MSANFYNTQYYVPQSPYSLSMSAGDSQNGFQAAATGGSSPSVSLSAWVTAPGADYLSSSSINGSVDLMYYYMISVPGGGNDPVPVTWSYSGGIDFTGSASYGNGFLGLQTWGFISVSAGSPYWAFGLNCRLSGDQTDECQQADTNFPMISVPGDSHSFSQAHTDAGYVPANTWNSLELGVFLFGYGINGIGNGNVRTYVDPLIQIDPDWLEQHPGSQVELNVPTSATPEPSSVLLLSGGIAGIASAVRRKLLHRT